MPRWGWAVVGTVIVLALVFWLGRATVPDRTAEVKAWRATAEAALADTAAARERADSAEARARALEGRADTTIRALAGLEALAVRRGAVVDSLRGVLATQGNPADSVAVLVAVVAQQDTTIREMRAGLTDAWDAMAGFRTDAAIAREELSAAHAESQRLRAVIAAGLSATKPSRGASRPIRCVVGVAASLGGSGVGGACGLALF